MNIELNNNWVMYCIIPHKVKPEHRAKFLACLLGDEMATLEEFREMFGYIGNREGCNWSCQGACCHPFMSINKMDIVFAECFGDEPNAQCLVDQKAKRALSERTCNGCSECTGMRLMDTAYYGVQRFYEQLFRDAKDGYIACYGDWEYYHKHIKGYFDEKPGMTDEVRQHFIEMMQSDLKRLTEAYDQRLKNTKGIEQVVAEIRFGLATHWLNYWEHKNKNEEGR